MKRIVKYAKQYSFPKMEGDVKKKRWTNIRSETHALDGSPYKPPKGSNMSYSAYLRTEHWNKKRKKALHYFGYRCCECGAEDVVLHVHHMHYNDLFREKLEDLRVLCVDCHDHKHIASQ